MSQEPLDQSLIFIKHFKLEVTEVQQVLMLMDIKLHLHQLSKKLVQFYEEVRVLLSNNHKFLLDLYLHKLRKWTFLQS